MGEAQNTADHFCAREGQCVLEQNAHEPRALFVHRQAVFLGREQVGGIRVAPAGGSPKRKKAIVEPRPHLLRLQQNPVSIGIAGAGSASWPSWAKKASSKLPTTAPTSKPIGADEGEFGVDDPRVFARQHDRAGVQIAVDQRLSARHELIFAALRGDFQRAVPLERPLVRVEIRPRPAIERRFAIGIGEDEIFCDLAERDVRSEESTRALCSAAVPARTEVWNRVAARNSAISAAKPGYSTPRMRPLRMMM